MSKLKQGWVVALSGTGINLLLGVLYSWSVISKEIPGEWGWTEADSALPYTIACLMFALMMVLAGKLQDRFGPRIVASTGGLLTGTGLILSSRFESVTMYIIGFGLLTGSGMAFGFAAVIPSAVKWFPAARTGMITGIIVSGYGLAPAYIAPLAQYSIGILGVKSTLLIFGIAFLIVVVLLSQLLANPPSKPIPAKAGELASPEFNGDYSAKEVLSTFQFYVLWLMYVFNAGAGLMVIGKLSKVVSVQAHYEAGFVLVAFFAVGNAGGRFLAGTLSDKLERIRVLQTFTFLQAILMFLTPYVESAFLLVIFSVCIGMNYGSNASLFPSITKDFFGLKNLGMNYGLVFTAWGVGSTLSLAAGFIYDRTKSFKLAFLLAGGLLVMSILLSLILKKPERCDSRITPIILTTKSKRNI